ncbi:MAG: methyltransferase domain-containing protein [Hyphomicrobiaceae bacterium]
MSVSGSSDRIFDRGLLAMRRARVATAAETADFLLDRVANDFAERLSLIKRDFVTCLNLGAHHGILSRRLRREPNVGTMIDMESVWPLARCCDGPTVVADEEFLPFADASLDLAVSGLALHLVNDLPGSLVQIRRALRPDGLLLAALLGGETLAGLADAWLRAEEEITGGASPRVAPSIDVRTLGGLLQRAGFALPVVDAERISVAYASPLALMRDIKAMGASNMLTSRSRRPVRRDVLARACDLYERQHSRADGRVLATFEILTVTAWAPDPGQQRPLRPGSAAMRLADALGTREHPAGDSPGGPGPGKAKPVE